MGGLVIITFRTNFMLELSTAKGQLSMALIYLEKPRREYKRSTGDARKYVNQELAELIWIFHFKRELLHDRVFPCTC